MKQPLPLLVLICCAPILAISQQDTSFLVSYSYKQKIAINQSSNSSGNETTQRKDDKLPAGSDSTRDGSAGEVKNLIDEFSFSVTAFILANKDSSKTYFRLQAIEADPNSNDQGVNVDLYSSVNMPDTIFYKSGDWSIQMQGDWIVPDRVELMPVETNEKKLILGYWCKKYIANNSEGKSGIIIWATEELPNTLLPYTGLSTFRGGILEIEHMSEEWHAVAKKIEITK
jgi:hypothetical protein